MLALFPHFRELARIEIYLLFARNCNKWNARLHSHAWRRQPVFYSSLKRKTKHKNKKKDNLNFRVDVGKDDFIEFNHEDSE